MRSDSNNVPPKKENQPLSRKEKKLKRPFSVGASCAMVRALFRKLVLPCAENRSQLEYTTGEGVAAGAAGDDGGVSARRAALLCAFSTTDCGVFFSLLETESQRFARLLDAGLWPCRGVGGESKPVVAELSSSP
jgi:hypothetical protein